MAEGRFGSLFLTIRTQNLSICAVGEKENPQLKDNLVPKISKFAIKGHCSRFEFTWQGRVHTVAHSGLRRFMAPLFGRSVSPVDPTCTCRCRQTCACFFYTVVLVFVRREEAKALLWLPTWLLHCSMYLSSKEMSILGSFFFVRRLLTVERLSESSRGPSTPGWGLTFS